MLAIDWSLDNQYLRSVSSLYESLFWEPHSAQRVRETRVTVLAVSLHMLYSSMQLKFASAVRDVDWATHTCSLAWSARGIWPTNTDGTEVNCVVANNNGPVISVTSYFSPDFVVLCVFLELQAT